MERLPVEAVIEGMTRRTLIFGTATAAAGAAFAQTNNKGPIPVAIVLSPGAVVIDYTGPWEVFQDAVVPGHTRPFSLYTVAERVEPIITSGGLKVVPDYSFANAPRPKIIIIPAQMGGTAVEAWLRSAAAQADLTMSVCTGALQLAKTGLLDGKSAATHHSSYRQFEKDFPKVNLKRGFRFVDEGKVASAGGLTSGIDLALHVVERYYGRDAAANTAYYMEYQGKGWMDATGAANSEYAEDHEPSGGGPKDIVCGMPVSKDTRFTTVRDGKTFLFCQQDCKDQFDKDPGLFLDARRSGK